MPLGKGWRLGVKMGPVLPIRNSMSELVKRANISRKQMPSTFPFSRINLGLPISLFGSSWAGLPFVPLNYRLAADEVQALADRISPTVTVTNNDLSSIVQGKEGVSLVTGDQLIDITTAGATLIPLGIWTQRK